MNYIEKDLGRSVSDSRKNTYLCRCGSIFETRRSSVNSGHTKSCGCLQKEVASKHLTSIVTTHGLFGTPEHNSWVAMLRRCGEQSSPSFDRYGGAGVKVEDARWLSFEHFLEDIGRMPQDGKRYTIDRVDPKMGYFKDNCRWATYKQQADNRGNFKNNTSGEKGVYWKVLRDTTYAIASYRDENSVRITKHFSTKKHGLLEAFAMAVVQSRKWRTK